MISLSLHEQFEGQVRNTPGSPAVTCDGDSLTYEELNERANRLAHYLKSLGVGHEHLVGLCLDRSLDTVVAILAVLKAGAAYVPMDPSNPAERVRMIVEDARCPVIVLHAAQQFRFADDDAALVVLDGPNRPWDSFPVSNPEPVATSDSLVYVMYTSGSTGRPKGVQITHGNVGRLFTSIAHWFSFGADDTWPLFHSFAFDLSVWEIWGALLHGGRIVVVPYLVSRSPSEFYRLLVEEKVTQLCQTPSALRQLQAYEDTLPREEWERLALRYIVLAGEALSFPSLASWFERHGDAHPQIINMYGITETTIHVTYRRVLQHEAVPGTPSYIGVPIPDQPCYILNDEKQPVAVGEEGELYVGGAGTARGYFNRPDLTAERFIPSPFPEDNGAILYKSGDLVRRLEGDMIYIGRIDKQVQLRGFRVELGEIETNLQTCPGVQASAVQPHRSDDEDLRLVAYYVADSPIPVETLREHLARVVPEYMIPSAFMRIEKMPLTGNGKTDYRALPEPVFERTGGEYVAPRNELEMALAAIWQELLHIPEVGIHDNFFELGGHSLLATRMIVRIRNQFAVHLPLRVVVDAPTIAGCALAISDAMEKGEALEHRTPAPRKHAGDRAPLSFPQERLWIIEQIQPGITAYQTPIFFEITGALDPDRFQRAFQQVVERHDALRTVIVADGDSPIQHVLDTFDVPFEVLSLEESLDDIAASAAARQAVSAATGTPMDLASGPLLKVALYRAGAERWYAGLIVHHVNFDGWSISVLLEEVAAHYAAMDEGREVVLPRLPLQYADFAAWQREQTATPEFLEQLAFWKRELEGPLPILDLPADFPRPPVQTFVGNVAQARIDAVQTEQLDQLALQHRKTLFVVLLAGWELLLQRYSGQDDIVIGSAIAGRNHEELEPLIGFFVNTVVLRMRLERDMPFPTFLDRVEDSVLAAQENQDVPFERVVAEVQHERDPSRSPIFQVLFILHNTPRYEASFSGLRITGEEISNGCAKFDLTLAIQPRDGGLLLNLEYNTALFEPATAERILGNFQSLLDAIVAAPEAPIGTFPMLTSAERDLLLRTWTDTAAPLDRSETLTQRFEALVAANPDAIAIADDDRTMTYGELDGEAGRLAGYLLAQGIGPEEPVPFFLSRTVRVMVAIIGILKAGAAYVPLDLLDPPARRERVLNVLRPRLILSERVLLPELEENSLPCICIDEENFPLNAPAPSARPAATGDSLAYIIFTSGSTGDPKGVCCTHQGVINLYQDLQDRHPVGPGDACAIWTAFSFDVSVYESWTSLLAGATLHIIPERVRVSPELCLNWLQERHMVTGYIPGFMLPALLERQKNDPLPLRRLLVGVEPLPESMLCDIAEATPGLKLLNLYGPTEAAIYVTLYDVPLQNPHPRGNAPIGKAIQNTRIYILDPDMNPLPVGVPGELYIAGVGLARGYYNDPELTARQFVPDPFSDLDTGRLYRTGDLVYFKPDGNIQFIRRMGRYIKLRGYRIEPGEIESVLRTHPDVSDAVVTAFGASVEEERLVAYVVPRHRSSVSEATLAQFLEAELPAHMRPAQFILMDALPRTVQGKLDRKRLPAPPEMHAATSADTSAAQTNAELELAALWREILHTEIVGRRDNFFSLGGNSLLAIQLVTRINLAFGTELTLLDFLNHPSIDALAAFIERSLQLDPDQELPDEGRLYVLKKGSKSPFFCASGAGDVMGSYGPLASALSDDQAFYCYSDLVQLTGDFQFTIESMAAAFVNQIRLVKPKGPYILGGYSFGGLLAYEAAKQLLDAGEEIAGLIMLDVSAYAEGARRTRSRIQALSHFSRRVLVRLWMTAYTWKLQLGYARDLAAEWLRPLLTGATQAKKRLKLRDCLRWIALDTLNQYFLAQGGLAKPRISDKRLEMIRESSVRDTASRLSLMEVAQAKYRIAPIPVAITLLRVAHDPWQEAKHDETLGWKHFAQRGVEVVVIPGNHMVMNREPYVQSLGSALQQCLDSASSKEN